MAIQTYIIQELGKRIKNDGLLWRTAEPDYFVELLTEKANTMDSSSVSDTTALEIVLLSLQALLNHKLGHKSFNRDYKRLNKELFSEQHMLLNEMEHILDTAIQDLAKQSPIPVDITRPGHLQQVKKTEQAPLIFKTMLYRFLPILQTSY